MAKTHSLDFGGTDCALPMLDALSKKIPVDCFVILTDSETWAGPTHPAEALRKYRQEMGIPAKLGPWGPMGNPYLEKTPEELWTPNRGAMEVSPGLTIGSIHHTEPICRVFGYLLPVVTNARLISAAPDMEKALEKIVLEFEGYASDGLDLAIAAIAKAKGETP